MAKIGELLVTEGLITTEQLTKALEEQRKSGERIGVILVRMGVLDEDVLVEFLGRQYRVPVVNPSKLTIPKDVLGMIPIATIQKYQVVPFSMINNVLNLAMADPGNLFMIDDLRFVTQKHVRGHAASESSIKAVVDSMTAADEDMEDVMLKLREDVDVDLDEGNVEDLDMTHLEDAAEQAPVVKLVNLILIDAVRKGASDIHIEPYEKMMRVRFRIDGVLYESMRPPLQLRNALISRIKIMSKLDIAERRLPQDGRIKLRATGKQIDFRVSILPTLFGEKVVMRILDKSALQVDMTKLGFEDDQLRVLKEAIYAPYGMILVTGPTGSGKTTSLYSVLTELNKVSHNISTVEDPVEYNLMGVNQVQIHEGIGLTFAAGLRAFLRQDPDIIMVGEIRDFETAEVATKAALTGHLVLSTLHTNDAPSTISRLLNMGIEPFLVSSAVNLILAQRLGRCVCKQCRTEENLTPEDLLNLGLPEQDLGTFACYRGRGCAACNNTGYRGRVGFYEIMPMHEDLRELVLVGATATEIKKAAVRLGMLTLRQAALKKLKKGMTSVEEVLRCTAKD